MAGERARGELRCKQRRKLIEGDEQENTEILSLYYALALKEKKKKPQCGWACPTARKRRRGCSVYCVSICVES